MILTMLPKKGKTMETVKKIQWLPELLECMREKWTGRAKRIYRTVKLVCMIL